MLGMTDWLFPEYGYTVTSMAPRRFLVLVDYCELKLFSL